MKPKLFSLVLLLVSSRVFSGVTDTLNLYYGNNLSDVSVHQKKLDSLLSALGAGDKLNVLGYCDYTGSMEYNAGLSERRALNVKQYLQSSPLYKADIIFCSGKGQVAKAASVQGNEGEPQNRRVDVIITRAKEPEKVVKEKPVEKKELKHLKTGESMDVEGLVFYGGRHEVLPKSVPVLHELLKNLLENPEVKFQIIGHVCCIGAPNDGEDIETGKWNLSVARAKSVYDFLLKNGISAERMEYKGVGANKPKVFPERSEEDQQANRRVEILIISGK